MKKLIREKRFNRIGGLQNEKLIKYFLSSNDETSHTIVIVDQNDNNEIKIDRLFNDKEIALNLIEFLYENSIPLEQSNEVVEDLLKDKGDKNKVSTLVTERKLSKIRNWQEETIIKYFLSKDSYDKYKTIISEITDGKYTEIEINKLFDDKETALDLIEFLYENSISLEQSNEVIEDLLKDKGDKNKVRTLIAERKLSKIRNWQEGAIIKYFLSKDNYDKYKIIILEQTDGKCTEIEINKLFDDKEKALNLIEFLYENSISLEQSNEVIEDLLRKREK